VTKLFDFKGEKPLDWFPTYQTLPYEGEPKGWRDKDNSRLEKFVKSDFYGKSILDIGCNVGAVLHYVKSLSVDVTCGVDCMEDTIALAKKIAEHYEQSIIYLIADILHEDFTKEFEAKFEREVFDTVLFLSVYHSIVRKIRLLDPEETERIWEHLDAVTGEVLYFEGHGNETEQQYRDLFKKYLPGYTINFLGMNHDYLNERYPGRPFFRLVKHRHYDMKDPSFKPEIIWKNFLKGQYFRMKVKGETTNGEMDFIRKEDLSINTEENYNINKDDVGMRILNMRINNGELINPPLVKKMGRTYNMIDGIHRTSLYFHMFKEVDEIPCRIV